MEIVEIVGKIILAVLIKAGLQSIYLREYAALIEMKK